MTQPDRLADLAIGATLSAAREARGLSVDDVARSTRIRAGLIRDIEADRFDACGGDVYARGHIRSIANTVGADGAVLVAAYDRERGGNPAAEAILVFEPGAVRGERRRPNWAAAMAVALVVICLWAAVDLLGTGTKTGVGKGTGGTRADTALTPPPTPTSSAPATAGPDAVAMVPPTAVSVRVRIIDEKCWVRVGNAANVTIFQGVLAPGDTKDFQDPEQIHLTLGNASAASLVVNGRDIGAPGSAGQVVSVAFGPGDPAGPQAG